MTYDIAIVCALHAPELDKVLQTGKVPWEPLRVDGDPTTYHETIFATAKGKALRVVAAAAPQMGMPASAVLATKMILHFRPTLVATVGIAAGVNSSKQGYGDILAPHTTFDYASGKITVEGKRLDFKPDPNPLRIDAQLHERLLHWQRQREQLDEIKQAWPAAKPRTSLEVHVGPLGSGPAVIDAKERVLDVAEHWRKLIGIEMEAYGVHLACQNAAKKQPEFLCMKSICDFADEKTDEWQAYAAFTAAQLCHRFLIAEWEHLFSETAIPR